MNMDLKTISGATTADDFKPSRHTKSIMRAVADPKSTVSPRHDLQQRQLQTKLDQNSKISSRLVKNSRVGVSFDMAY